MIDRAKGAMSVVRWCRLLGRARSSYYAARNKPAAEPDPRLMAVIAVHESSRQTYGSRRMSAALRLQGHAVGRQRARSLMRQAGLAVARRRYQHYRRHTKPAAAAPNHLNRQFQPVAPNQVWAGDITYLRTTRGWLYLAIVVDLYARRIVGWAFSSQADTDLAIRALELAVSMRRPGKGLMFHSDQGCQYSSERFVATLQRLGMVQSMSRRGNCWDNAVVERVFCSLKREWIGDRRYRNQEEAQADVTRFVATYYNHHRLHSAMKHLPPAVFETLAA